MNQMKKPKLAILDGDILAYRAAFWADVEGIEDLESRFNQDVTAWTPKECDEVLVAFSCTRKNNFRKLVWPSYKDNRKSSHTPDSLGVCKEVLGSMYPSIVEPSIEADDIMGCYVSSGKAIGVTIDKDLRTIPGYHWNPDKEAKVVRISEEGADLFLYQQWMQGDTTDGIPGLWKVGPKKAQKFIRGVLDDGGDVPLSILEEYKKEERPVELEIEPEEYCIAMARCVRILRTGEYDFDTQEVSLWNPIVGYSDIKEI